MVEILFYLTAFAVFAFVALAPSLRRLAINVAVVAFIGLHIVNENLRPIFPALQFAPYFALGVCLFGIVQGSRAAKWGSIVCYALILVHFARYIQAIPTAFFDNHASLTAANLVAICFMAIMPILILILANITVTTNGRYYDNKLGNLSYSLYLNHYIVIVVALSIWISWTWLGFAVIDLAAITLSAFASILIEAPMKPMRDRIRGVTLATGDDSEFREQSKFASGAVCDIPKSYERLR
jgi:peptidoglycan/LPS O-acetylase OafA/YrhL